MESIRWSDARRGATVLVVEVIALAFTAYAGFVAFVLVPPGVGGGSQDSTGLAVVIVVLVAIAAVIGRRSVPGYLLFVGDAHAFDEYRRGHLPVVFDELVGFRPQAAL